MADRLNTREKYFNEFESQDDEVKNYFTEICNNDPHKLDLHFFFGRVCTSMKLNGIELTSTVYELDIEYLKKIKV